MLPRFASSGSGLGLAAPSLRWAQAAAIRPTASRRLPTTARPVRKLMSFSPPLPRDVHQALLGRAGSLCRGRGVTDLGRAPVRLPALAQRETNLRSLAGPGIFLL